MTPEQIFREMQEADKIREGMLARAAEKTQEAVDKLRESPMAEWYGKAQEMLTGPVGDMRRRVVEEPWFGQPVADILYERQQDNFGRDKDQNDPDPGKPEPEMVGEAMQELKERENVWERLWGAQKDAGQDRGRDEGMEP